MTRNKFKKEKISIQNIGKKRFWIGIFVGLFFAISISLIFSLTREFFRVFTSMSNDLMIQNSKELSFNNYFFALLSSVLGFTQTIWIWMSNRTHNRKMDKLYKQLSRTNASLIFWLILFIITQLSFLIFFGLFGIMGCENQLNLENDFWIIYVLLPLVIFTQSWYTVRLVYKSKKWIFISMLICIITTIILSKSTTINQEIVNNIYFEQYEKDYKYIEMEISKSKEKYGIAYDLKTINILKKWRTENSINQVNTIKKAFKKNNKVVIDTIILQKIIIHNFKIGNYHFYPLNSMKNWDYASPQDIYRQIKYYPINSNEIIELFEILKEQIDIINLPKEEWIDYENDTKTEKRKREYYIPKALVNQLIEIQKSLSKNKKYYELNKILPKIINANKNIHPNKVYE